MATGNAIAPSAVRLSGVRVFVITLLREALERERTLTLFALFLFAAMGPTLLALGLDDRQLRGVSVWAKPLKFMASIGLFSICTAWFYGLLPLARRRAPMLRALVGVIVVAGLFEIGYITLQSALGEASHFNFSDSLHVTLYTLMGLGAVAMTATQPVLAWQVARHGREDVDPTWRLAVVLGLILTFALGAGAGGLLSAVQPPGGAGLPVVGWHGQGDLRPAHFLGMHAQQWLPLAGGLLVVFVPGRDPVAQRKKLRVLWMAALVLVLLWGWAVMRGLNGAQWTLPPAPLT